MASRARKAAKKDDKAVMRITLDGKTYDFHYESVTGRQANMCRRQTGMSVRGAYLAMKNDPDIDCMATLIWLSRLQAGEDVTFDEVAEEIDYNDDFDLEAKDEPEEVDATDPEA